MATITGAVSQSVVSQRNAQVRRRSTLYVGIGEDVFWVPRQAAKETEYPLLGIQHMTIDVPREEIWKELRSYLAYELKTSRLRWEIVWQCCLREKRRFFRQYVVVLLARPSRLLPAGNVVFKSMTNIINIPSSELNYLSARDRRCVQEAYTEAVMTLPEEKRLHFLQPVYTPAGAGNRLATVQDVVTLATQRRDALYEFCCKQKHRVRIDDSPEHLSAAWEQYAKQYAVARNAIGTLAMRIRGIQSRTKLDEIVTREETELAALARRLGIKAETGRLQHFALRLLDPILAFEEPAWKLPIYGDDVAVLRLVVHWDDKGVTLLK